MAIDLDQAAAFAETDLFPLWQADTLKAKVIAFWKQALPTFPEQLPKGRPIADWLTVIAAFAPTILDYVQTDIPNFNLGITTAATFQQVVQYVYRVCRLGAHLLSTGDITQAQADALLAAYNDQFT